MDSGHKVEPVSKCGLFHNREVQVRDLRRIKQHIIMYLREGHLWEGAHTDI